MEMVMDSRLVDLCIEEACKSRESVERWRRQRRTLERMPSHLADALLRRLLRNRLVFPSLLEVFKHSVEDIDLRGESSVDAEWIAYIGAYSHLRSLNLSCCQRINSSALWPISGMACLKELDLSRCAKLTDAGISHLLSILTLEKLWISETGVTQDGIPLLASLKNLSLLDLGGLPVTDRTLKSLQGLPKLEYLDLWGSNLTDECTSILYNFPSLSSLNLTWTSVTKIPIISSLQCLNLSNCTVCCILKVRGIRPSLRKLVLSGSTLESDAEAFLFNDTYSLTFLDLSNSSIQSFGFLEKMKMLEYLDLSSTSLGDDSVEFVACIGENLQNLNLSNTRISSAGVGTLVGHVPKLETLSLSHTAVDDVAVSYISMITSIVVLDLSNTNIRGFIHEESSKSEAHPSLASLQMLNHLERLNLKQNHLYDSALYPLSSLKKLTHLSLRSPSLTDATLHQLSSLPKLANLQIRDAVLTDQGLNLFRPQPSLKKMDLGGCWLLTEDAIASLCKRYLGIEVRHEFVPSSLSDHNTPNRPSTSRLQLRRTWHKNKNQEPLPISQCFLDQRVKYSRAELLDLQNSPVSVTLVRETCINLPQDLTE